jgi:folate-binding protein YgfZ
MSMPVGIDLSVGPEAFGVLALRGADAARFLQGQLSADIESLAPATSTLAGLHNPQGRVVALLALARTAPDEFFAALPRELAEVVAQRLRKYVLRAKLSIEEVRDVRVLGSESALPGCCSISWGTRHLSLVPGDRLGQLQINAAGMLEWQRADVHEGLPQVYAATSESFVAQMLNLDLLGAISFDKGCYTGQEVIARAHYRGRVKRRLQRWIQSDGPALKPGDSARSTDGRTLSVVRVAESNQAAFEILAVGPFGPLEGSPGAESAAANGGVVLKGPLPLPYRFPDGV